MSAAPSDAAAAAPAPGEKKAARLPGWRGHHKLYLAAVALVAVCVWLIVWLVVFGKVLPDDIVGFAAIVFQVTRRAFLRCSSRATSPARAPSSRRRTRRARSARSRASARGRTRPLS